MNQDAFNQAASSIYGAGNPYGNDLAAQQAAIVEAMRSSGVSPAYAASVFGINPADVQTLMSKYPAASTTSGLSAATAAPVTTAAAATALPVATTATTADTTGALPATTAPTYHYETSNNEAGDQVLVPDTPAQAAAAAARATQVAGWKAADAATRENAKAIAAKADTSARTTVQGELAPQFSGGYNAGYMTGGDDGQYVPESYTPLKLEGFLAPVLNREKTGISDTWFGHYDAGGNWQGTQEQKSANPWDFVLSVAAMVPGPWQPFAIAANALNAASKGDILGAAAAIAGISGYTDAASALRIAKAIESGNIAGVITGALNVGGITDVNGISTQDIARGFNVAQAINSGNFANAALGAAGLAGVTDVGGVSLKDLTGISTALQAVASGNTGALINAGLSVAAGAKTPFAWDENIGGTKGALPGTVTTAAADDTLSGGLNTADINSLLGDYRSGTSTGAGIQLAAGDGFTLGGRGTGSYIPISSLDRAMNNPVLDAAREKLNAAIAVTGVPPGADISQVDVETRTGANFIDESGNKISDPDIRAFSTTISVTNTDNSTTAYRITYTPDITGKRQITYDYAYQDPVTNAWTIKSSDKPPVFDETTNRFTVPGTTLGVTADDDTADRVGAITGDNITGSGALGALADGTVTPAGVVTNVTAGSPTGTPTGTPTGSLTGDSTVAADSGLTGTKPLTGAATGATNGATTGALTVSTGALTVAITDAPTSSTRAAIDMS